MEEGGGGDKEGRDRGGNKGIKEEKNGQTRGKGEEGRWKKNGSR